MSSVSDTFKYSIMGIMITAGAINTIGMVLSYQAFKFQNKQYVYEGGYYKLFFHPYIQTFSIFFAQFLALLLFFFRKYRNPQEFQKRQQQARQKGLIIGMNKFLLAIPALMDVITSGLNMVALNFVSGSVYQMMRGGSIISTMIFSVIFLKVVVKKRQIFGSILVLIGVFLVGLSNTIFKDPTGGESSIGMQIVGILLLVMGFISSGFMYVFEQKLFAKYHLQSLEVVGYQGCFGLIITFIIILIFTFIPCGLGIEACVLNNKGISYMERPERYFAEIGENGALLFFVILSIFSILAFNVAGVSITKYVSAVARTICDVTRTVFVWGIGIIVTVTAGQLRPNYKWELVGVGVILVQLLGFIILILGNLIYNNILKLPFISVEPEPQPQYVQQQSEESLRIDRKGRKKEKFGDKDLKDSKCPDKKQKKEIASKRKIIKKINILQKIPHLKKPKKSN